MRSLFMALCSIIFSIHGFSQTALLTFEKKPTKPLLHLLDFLSITHDGTIEQIVKLTQKKQPEGCMRDAGKERWELEAFFKNKEAEITKKCSQLNMIEAVTPQKKEYEYALILGATIHALRARISHLMELWQNGIRFKKLIFLAGQRPVSPTRETHADFINHQNGLLRFKNNWTLQKEPQTETDIVHLIIEQSVLPKEWADAMITIVDTPLQKTGNGLQRPTTEDTIRAWLATNPTPSSLLVISSQPFVGYQDAVLRRFLPQQFALETIGAETKKPVLPEVLLDTVARWLYNAQHLTETQLKNAN